MKHTLKDDIDLFAKELNLNPEDYKIGKIIYIALETIKSSDNPLVMERIHSYREIIKRASVEFKPHIKKAKEDKPGLDTLVKFRDILNEENFNYDIQDLLKEFEKESRKTRVKDKTKPKGHSKTIAKRNDKIRKEYYNLKEKGKTIQEACNILSNKYGLSSESIKSYVKK